MENTKKKQNGLLPAESGLQAFAKTLRFSDFPIFSKGWLNMNWQYFPGSNAFLVSESRSLKESQTFRRASLLWRFVWNGEPSSQDKGSMEKERSKKKQRSQMRLIRKFVQEFDALCLHFTLVTSCHIKVTGFTTHTSNGQLAATVNPLSKHDPSKQSHGGYGISQRDVGGEEHGTGILPHGLRTHFDHQCFVGRVRLHRDSGGSTWGILTTAEDLLFALCS